MKKRATPIYWTPDEDIQLAKRLEELKGKQSATIARILAPEFKRSEAAIESRISKYKSGENIIYQWSNASLKILQSYKDGGIISIQSMYKLCAKFPERTYEQIRYKLSRMGIRVERRTAPIVKQAISHRTNNNEDRKPTTLCNKEEGNPYYKIAKHYGETYDPRTGLITKLSAAQIVEALRWIREGKIG